MFVSANLTKITFPCRKKGLPAEGGRVTNEGPQKRALHPKVSALFTHCKSVP